ESAAIPDDPALETAAQAIAMLDAQFPWLRGAEKHPGSRLLSLAHQTVGSAGRLGGFVRRDAACANFARHSLLPGPRISGSAPVILPTLLTARNGGILRPLSQRAKSTNVGDGC